MNQKKVFIIIFASLAVILMILPFTLSINDMMTKEVERLGWYIWIQNRIVPMEVSLVGVIIKSLGITFVGYRDGFSANGNLAIMSWNCLGWQSLVLFVISIVVGFRAGKYTFTSKLEAILVGLLGTFLMNLARITFTIILLVFSKPLFAVVFHDYLAAIFTIVWLTLFWWFSYRYVLEDKKV
jgi:exosortase/archaeosortase family protein